MKFFFRFFISVFILQSCGVAGLYYTLKEEREGSGGVTIPSYNTTKEVSAVSIPIYEDINLSMHFFTGHVSYFSIRASNTNKIEIKNLKHEVYIDGKPILYEIEYESCKTNIVISTSGYACHKRYKLESYPNNVVERLELSLLINGQQYKISKEFVIKKRTYSGWEALMGF